MIRALGPVLVGALYIGLALTEQGPLALRIACKAVPVAALAAWVWAGPRSRLRDGVGVGLLFALAGDIVLDLPAAWSFLVGLALNLVAHIAYIVGFSGPPRRLGAGFALAAFGFVGGLIAFLWGGLGEMQLPVLAYATAIGAMIWRAGARAVDRAGWIGFFGAVGFAVCDSLIALDRFHAPIPGVALPIMLSYWLGQWGIAASARFSRPAG